MNDEIEIFLNSDDEEQTKQVYAFFGLAVYFAQVLEQHAINMIALKRMLVEKITKPQEVDELWNKYEGGKKTFGALITEINKLYDLTDKDKEKLNTFRDKRNFLTHDYFKFNVDIFYNEKGKLRMVQDFIRFREEAKEVDTMLTNYFDEYQKMAGITEERLSLIMDELRKKSEELIVDESYDSYSKKRETHD